MSAKQIIDCVEVVSLTGGGTGKNAGVLARRQTQGFLTLHNKAGIEPAQHAMD